MEQQIQWPTQKNKGTSSIIVVRRAAKIFLYFLGIFLAEFGFLGISATIFGSVPRAGYLAVFFGLAALIISLIFFFRTRYKAPSLSCLQYFWWLLGATIGVIMFVSLDFVLELIIKDNQFFIGIFSFTVLLYGGALVGIAHLQPPLRQQVHESVQSILKTIPGKQMVVADLLSLLKNDYNCPDDILNQYLGSFSDIEQMAIPGTPMRLCRIKGTMEHVAFPQVHSIANYGLRQSVSRALSFLNEDNVDIGLYLLSKDFEDTLKIFLVSAGAIGKLSRTPGGKSPEKLTLPEMVSCLKINGIITNDAVLSFLRQVRNDRAHGTMPSLAEKQLLMRSASYIASLYIDHIKLFDDLTHNF